MPPAKRLKKADGKDVRGAADPDLTGAADSEQVLGTAATASVRRAESKEADQHAQALAPSPWAGAAAGTQLMDDDDDHLSDFLDDSFIESQENGEDGGDDEEEGQDHRINDPACPECDDGGTVLYCDGNCMRSFHVGIENEQYTETYCNPMGMPEDLYSYLKASNEAFECPNCLAQVHQCFKCKLEGIAEPSNPDRDIYRCPAAACGKFYHPECLKRSADNCQKMLCPLHSCTAADDCKWKGQEGGAREPIPCRRCPKAYHFQCIPAQLYGPARPRKGQHVPIRVWLAEADAEAVGMPPNPVDRSLVYCMDHPILKGEENPSHQRPLMRMDLLKAWRQHYAQQFPTLASSKDWLAKHSAPKATPRPQAMAVPRPAATPMEPISGALGFRDGRGEAPGSPAHRKKSSSHTHSPPADPKTAPSAAQLSSPRATSSGMAAQKTSPMTEQLRSPGGAPSASAAALLSPPRDILPAAILGGTPSAMLGSPKGSVASQITSPAASIRSPDAVLQSPDRQRPVESLGLQAAPSAEVPQALIAGQEQSAEEPAADDTTENISTASIMEVAEQHEQNFEGKIAELEQTAGEEQSAGMQQTDAECAVAGEVIGEGALQEVAEGLGLVDMKGVANDAEEERPQEPAESHFKQLEYWTPEAIQQRNEALWACAGQTFTYERVLEDTRRPLPYSHPFRKTITENKLHMYREAFKAVEVDPQNAHSFIDASGIRELYSAEDNMRTVLAPWLHRDRYTSYGRHFTHTHLLKDVASRLQPFAQAGDTVVDFSCGANEFVPIFKRTCLENGKEVQGCAFDIITPRLVEDFTQCSWFEVREGMLPAGESLIIGLNPPFGKNNSLAEQFIQHAAEWHRPRIIVLIVPPGTKAPYGYDMVLDDRYTMHDRAFYIPGLSQEQRQQWNKVTPAFRILIRSDMVPLQQGNLCLSHLAPASQLINYQQRQVQLHAQAAQQQMYAQQQYQMQQQLRIAVPGYMPVPYMEYDVHGMLR